MYRLYFHLYRIRNDPSEMVDHQLFYFMMILMRNKPARQFGVSFRRQYRLGSFSCITTPNAADIESGTYGRTFECRITFLAEKRFHTYISFIFVFIVRNSCQHIAFFTGNFLDIIIKTGQCNTTIGIGKGGNHLTKDIDGIGYRSAENTRMQIVIGSGYLDLPICQTA